MGHDTHSVQSACCARRCLSLRYFTLLRNKFIFKRFPVLCLSHCVGPLIWIGRTAYRDQKAAMQVCSATETPYNLLSMKSFLRWNWFYALLKHFIFQQEEKKRRNVATKRKLYLKMTFSEKKNQNAHKILSGTVSWTGYCPKILPRSQSFPVNIFLKVWKMQTFAIYHYIFI